MRVVHTAIIVGSLFVLPAAASAKNIVLSNDDGLSSNIVALYNALKAAGHDVIVSVPCENQSGVGSAINLSTPQSRLTAPCRSDAAQIGAPIAGPITRKGINGNDFYYVLGTPVMSLLYGVDVAAQKRWGRAPDIVMSGPNEGQNLGSIIVNSGTVNVAESAALRGIPAIALSGSAASADDKTLANPESAKIAALSVKFLDHLLSLAGSGPVLPAGLVLNVNFPNTLEGATWKSTRVGTYNAYAFGYAANVAASASPMMLKMAKEHDMPLPSGPGVSIALNTAPPTADQADDESVVNRKDITVSPLQAGFQAPALEGVTGWLTSGMNPGAK
ncbi:MAG: 5'/3'-nucleotidase SurE [Sphingomonadales bacterium]|nr:5'/3'-nucleotidase SurE [Sphingomonadales bacterium]